MSFTLLPATAEDFVNREKEISEMLKVLGDKKSTLGFALYGKRRVGKTSILKEVERRLKSKKDIIPVYFSVLDLAEKTIPNFAKELGAAIIELYRPRLNLKYRAKDLIRLPFNLLGDILRDLKISLEVKNIISLSLGFDKHKPPDLEKLIDDMFILPEKLAEETNNKCVLFIDEFPEIMNLKKNGARIGIDIIGKIRTIMEDKKRISLTISGSIRKTMDQVAISPTSAFYRQFIIKLIEPLDKDSVKILFKKNLPRASITKDAVESLHNLTKGFPFYVQFIGRIIQHSGVKKIIAGTIEEAVNTFLTQEGNLIFKEEFSSLSDSERSILMAMAIKNLTNPSDLARELSADSSLIAKTLLYLIEKGIVEKIKKGGYNIEDPVFELWLKRLE